MRRRHLLAALTATLPVAQARAAPAGGIAILTYHRVDPITATAATVVTQHTLETQLAWLADNHVHVLPIDDAVAALRPGGPPIPGPAVVITADDGFRSVHTHLFPLLREHGFPATLFLNPPMIGRGGAYLTWPLIEQMQATGLVDIQAHTLTHPNFRDQKAHRTEADYAGFIAHELADSARQIEARLGGKVRHLAWPYGIHDLQLEAAAQAAGFEAAFALGSRAAMPGDNPFAIPRYQVYETDTQPRFAAITQGVPRRRK
jgi:peptidoglycan/xylan/chitin deacetylase (PgdA/CDA1 family)